MTDERNGCPCSGARHLAELARLNKARDRARGWPLWPSRRCSPSPAAARAGNEDPDRPVRRVRRRSARCDLHIVPWCSVRPCSRWSPDQHLICPPQGRGHSSPSSTNRAIATADRRRVRLHSRPHRPLTPYFSVRDNLGAAGVLLHGRPATPAVATPRCAGRHAGAAGGGRRAVRRDHPGERWTWLRPDPLWTARPGRRSHPGRELDALGERRYVADVSHPSIRPIPPQRDPASPSVPSAPFTQDAMAARVDTMRGTSLMRPNRAAIFIRPPPRSDTAR